jgi:hypothetical protein
VKGRFPVALNAVLVVLTSTEPLLAWSRGGYSGGSVHAGSGGWGSHSGGSWQGRYGNASGSRSVSQTSSGYDVNRQMQTQSGASHDVNRSIDTQDQSVSRSSTATNAYGQSAERDRTTTDEGGYASVQGSASTSTGRAASGSGTVSRNAYGQPVVAGNVDTKYNGDYAGAAVRNPYGGWNTAVAGPNGMKVTTTLPSGYRTTTYAGTPYYGYGGAYYRPYTYGGVPYYYPVPPPYYCTSSYVPVGAIALAVAGTTYMVAQGSYYKQTTNSQGTVVYQTVPAPVGASLQVLPAQSVLVTVGGTTYFLYANTFYREISNLGQQQFVVISPPPGVVFVAALPSDFQVVQLNTMYFEADGHYYVRYLSPAGSETYVVVDPPQQTQAAGAAMAPLPVAAPPPPPVPQTLVVPSGTLILVRLADDLSSATAKQGDRFQGFLGQSLAASGAVVAAQGTLVYGTVTKVNKGDRMHKTPEISAVLNDIQLGGSVVPIQTQPLEATGEAGKGRRRLLGGAGLGAAIGAIADGGHGAAVGAAIGAGTGLLATAASSQDGAVLSSQSLQAFTVAVPFDVQVATQVAAR